MIQSTNYHSNLSEVEKKIDILGSTYRKLIKSQVIRLDLDGDGEYYLPHSKKTYEAFTSGLELLEISEFIKNKSLQKSFVKEVENLKLEQVYVFLSTVIGIKQKYLQLDSAVKTEKLHDFRGANFIR